ncbi:MAG: class I SAM-dependent methyltransferase [Candidatus Micrarchaeaceae archaeon]|jgi:tRNA (guanine37-N1)-methyltransferase
MLGLKASKGDAERVRKYLARHKLMDNNYRLISDDEFIYFPISRGGIKRVKGLLKGRDMALADKAFARAGSAKNYRELLAEKLGAGYDKATKSYDIIGDIAIIDAEDMAVAKVMAAILMGINRNVSTVLAKGGPVKGRYRIRDYIYIAGRRRYSTIYKENGASFAIDVRKAFFSSRLAFERERINKLVGTGENVVVMFAGAGPFAVEIAKRHRDSRVVAIELNKEAYRYMVQNIKLNKAENVTAELGDVKKVAKKYRRFADRIIMPLPESSREFLGSVVLVARRGCVVHYYAFGERESAFKDCVSELREFFRKARVPFRVVSKKIVRPYSASRIEVCIDFRIY